MFTTAFLWCNWEGQEKSGETEVIAASCDSHTWCSHTRAVDYSGCKQTIRHGRSNLPSLLQVFIWFSLQPKPHDAWHLQRNHCDGKAAISPAVDSRTPWLWCHTLLFIRLAFTDVNIRTRRRNFFGVDLECLSCCASTTKKMVVCNRG